MSVSADDRRKNVDEALVSILNSIGDGHFIIAIIKPDEHPEVMETTWTQLVRMGYLSDMNLNVTWYKMEPLGYVRALRLSGRCEDPKFQEDLGKLSSALKETVKGRSTFSFVGCYDLMAKTGLSEAFIRNAIDADLVGNIFGRIGVEWAGDHFVRVPHDFGLEPI